jgi:Cu/Zn superoxide dismutase
MTKHTIGYAGLALVAAAGFLAAALPVPAQIAPGDTGAGVKRGMEQLNYSAQVGTVTLFDEGSRTRVVLDVKSEPPGWTEGAYIQRGQSCTLSEIDPAPAYFLHSVVNGHSETVVDAPAAKLLSGNYVVVVHAGVSGKALRHYVSCGHLYQD